MSDISEQVKESICRKLKELLETVRPFVANYRKLDILQKKLRQTFPEEQGFEDTDSTVKLLKMFLSKDEIHIKRNFKDRKRNNEIITVYSLPSILQVPDASVKNIKEAENARLEKEHNAESAHIPNEKKPDSAGYEEKRKSTETTEKTRQYELTPLQEFAFFLDYAGAMDKIAQMAQPEDWAFGESEGKSRHPILESYLNHVIERLKYEEKTLGKKNKIVTGQSTGRDACGNPVTKEMCIFNTGLLSTGKEYIYLLFEKNNRPGAQEWFYKKPTDDVRGQDFLPFNGNIPRPASFYSSASRSITVMMHEISAINVDHILLGHLERFPLSFLRRYFSEYFSSIGAEPTTADDWDKFKKYLQGAGKFEYNMASAVLQRAIEEALKKALADDSWYVNVYRSEEHSVCIFLPLYLEKPKGPKDFEVGVIIDSMNGSYIVRTIYRTCMAYKRIRLMGNHKRDWLDPKRIKDWTDPYSKKNRRKSQNNTIMEK